MPWLLLGMVMVVVVVVLVVLVVGVVASSTVLRTEVVDMIVFMFCVSPVDMLISAVVL
jgi:hypothetical protein